jgi:hypothetical protein
VIFEGLYPVDIGSNPGHVRILDSMSAMVVGLSASARGLIQCVTVNVAYLALVTGKKEAWHDALMAVAKSASKLMRFHLVLFQIK